MREFSYFLPTSLSFSSFVFYFPPDVSFIVRANACHQLQTPTRSILVYELVSASSVRHLESRKDCQMVSQICSVHCLGKNGADIMTGFSDVVDTLSRMLLQDVRLWCSSHFISMVLIHHKFRLGVNNLFYKYEKLIHGRLTVT